MDLGPDTWSNVNLSDDNSTYVEIQGGATASQEAYYYLEPQQIRTFQENWMPIRLLGGISKANMTAALNLARSSTGILAEVLATRNLSGVRLQLWQGGLLLRETSADIAPEQLATLNVSGINASPVTFRLVDSTDTILLEKTERQINSAGTDEYKPGQKTDPSWLTTLAHHPRRLPETRGLSRAQSPIGLGVERVRWRTRLLPRLGGTEESLGPFLRGAGQPGKRGFVSEPTRRRA